MMMRFAEVIYLTAMLALASAASGEPASSGPMQIRATVELTDGSCLIGTPASEPLSLSLGYAHLEIPLDQIRRWDTIMPVNKPVGENDKNVSANKVTVQLTNGDRLTGAVDVPQLRLDTILGPITPKLKFVRSVTYAAWCEGNMPPGNGTLAFCGLNWLTWRTEFAIDGSRLKSLPQARPGFQYGHEGHGRGPMLIANLGDPAWRDYSLDVRFCATGVDPALNPYGLGSDFHDGAILFHIADAKESQNVRGNSFYILGLHSDGSWELRAVYNHFCDQPIGWGNPKGDGDRTLAHGTGLAIDRQNGNRIRIDVLGNRIQAWFEDQRLLDIVDEQMSHEIGGQRLDHGGVGFVGGFDAMFWIKDASVRSLNAQRKRD